MSILPLIHRIILIDKIIENSKVPIFAGDEGIDNANVLIINKKTHSVKSKFN